MKSLSTFGMVLPWGSDIKRSISGCSDIHGLLADGALPVG